jgi:tetratricopeptide (TPR) repeat protein
VYYRLGRAYAAAGRYSEAASALERSTRLLDEAPEGAIEGDPQEGEDGLALDVPPPPDIATAYNWLGKILIRRGNMSAAEVADRKAIMQGPRVSEPHRALGEIYERRGETELALSAYQQYLQLFPDGEGAAKVRHRLKTLQGMQ